MKSRGGNPVPTEYAQSVRRAAQRLLERAGINGVPVDLDRLAQLQGIREIREANLGSTDAQLIPCDEGFVIEVNRFVGSQRRRFSIAHEIAHTFFNPRARAYRRTGTLVTIPKERPSNPVEEALCDMAAAEMLLPTRFFSRLACDLPTSIAVVEHLAAKFDASVEATALRYGTLLGDRCQVIVWSRKYNVVHPKWTLGLRVREVGDFPLRSPRSMLECNVAEAFLTDRVVAANDTDRSVYPPTRLWIQSKGFRHGSGRYVLALLRSAFYPKALDGG